MFATGLCINERTTMPSESENEPDSTPAEFGSSPDHDLNQQTEIPDATGESTELGAAPQTMQQPQAFELPLKFLHPTSLVFDLMAHVRSYLFPLGFGLWGAANGNIQLLIISGILFIPAVARSTFRYFTLRYRIEDAHLVVDQGLVFSKTRSIPVNRIQNIDLTQNVLHRIFKVAEVKIETASGTEAEAVLRVLSMEEVDTLRSAIFAGKDSDTSKQAQPSSATELMGSNTVTAASSGTADESIPISDYSTSDQSGSDTNEIWKIPFLDLVKAGLASNRGLVMLGIALVTFDQFTENGYESIFAFLTDHLPEDTGSQRFYLLAIAASISGFVLLRVVGIVWYVLRFFDYRLVRRGDDLRLSCGLLTRVSATVPRKRIQFISVQQNLIMRWFGVATIRVETAGGATDKAKPTQSIAKAWFMPVIPVAEVPQIVNLLRPDIQWQPESFDFQSLAPRASTRMIRIAFVKSFLFAIAVAGVYCQWTKTLETQALLWGGIAGLVVLPGMILFAKKKAVSRKYARIDNAVVYRTGVFGRKTSVTFFDKVQTVACSQTPFDRRWGMATLAIDTAAAGPAEHRIVTPYLDADFAKSELKALRSLAVQAAS